MKLSVVVTLLNEEDNIQPLLTNISKALTGHEYEIILVDDGSTDGTVRNIRKHADEHVKLVIFNKNYGQTTAIAAGIDYASGDYIITMDGDLQNDPTDIPVMLEKLEAEGWDVVAGYRKNRQDGMLLRKIPSKLANALIRKLSGVHIRDYGCTLKIFTKQAAKELDLYGELHRFIPILAKLKGAKITEMAVKHHPRIHGTSKYGIGRTFKVISDLILMLFYQKYFRRPIHLFGPLGIIALAVGGLINFYLLVEKLLGKDIWGRPLLILGVLILLAGIQFITFGLIAELMMRIYYESQNKKTYSIKDIFIGESKNTSIPQTTI
ncbi:glycosyltransferase family 2 protein [Fulvivirga ligni]|uniref:glycosyltransferase family 2 protein n=1 Tax=Fulvivirga ligni TaxID=2904246 RepID=UPI001F46A4C7|nr:glycosyltransferase family 2 protein [Fulvivirga ligni]UII21048.1 glycosyltransferase family 2 protein [Fulvivirga ligni]